jgi:outer membrane protein assembly factor BamD
MKKKGRSRARQAAENVMKIRAGVSLRSKALLLVALLILFFLGGCSLWKKQDMTKATPEGLYRQGHENYQDGHYAKAIESFRRLKEEYPLSQLAIMAELGIADSFFSQKEYGDALMAYSDFLNLHPINENLPYAMYQLGMCHYLQMYEIDRDQTETLSAKKEFERLVARFPDSKFSFLAEKMIRDCNVRLGEHEFYVGHLYFKMKKYEAALKRFEIVTKKYPNIGLDYKVNFFIAETKKKIVEEEARKAGALKKEKGS